MNQEEYMEKPIIFTIERAAQLYIQLTKALLVAFVIPFVLFSLPTVSSLFSAFKWIIFLY